MALAAVAGLVLWRLLRGARGATAARGPGDAGWSPGPWPIEPGRVATRAELVAAFEHLCLLVLGVAARHWNHHQLAAMLAEHRASERDAAHQLASAYEQARYAPATLPLSEAAMTEARRHLCLLAGVPAS